MTNGLPDRAILEWRIRLQDRLGNTSIAGSNPFDDFTVGEKKLSTLVTLYDPLGGDSKAVYDDIMRNIESLVERAIANRT